MEKEVSEADRRLLLRKKYLDNINSILSKDFVDQAELYSLVRGFFSELLKLDYQFTYEELSTELNKIFIKPSAKKDVDDFLYLLSESEYFLEKDLEQPEVKTYLSRLLQIVQTLIYDSDSEAKGVTFFEKLFKKSKTQKPDDELKQSESSVIINNQNIVSNNAEVENLPVNIARPIANQNMQDILQSQNKIPTNQLIPAVELNAAIGEALDNRMDVLQETMKMKSQMFTDRQNLPSYDPLSLSKEKSKEYVDTALPPAYPFSSNNVTQNNAMQPTVQPPNYADIKKNNSIKANETKSDKSVVYDSAYEEKKEYLHKK